MRRPSDPGAFPSGSMHGSEDSGLIDLQALSQRDVNDVDRASVTPLASAGLFDDEVASSSPAHPAARSAPAAAVPFPTFAPEPRPSLPSMPPPAVLSPLFASSAGRGAASAGSGEGSRRGSVVVLGGVLALVAGAFLVLRPHARTDAGEVVQVVAPAAQTPGETKPETKPASAQTAAATDPAQAATAQAALEAPHDGTIDPMALPVRKPNDHAARAAAAATPASNTHAAPVAVARGAKVASDGKAEPRSAPAPDAKLVAKDLPASPGTTGALGDAMKQAAGSSGTPEASGAGAAAGAGVGVEPGSVPQKPSQGAVRGALGAVLPGARGCLGPDDAISRAQVVFGSNGAVQSINVTGSAAGKPAEACIKGALSAAKVPPFAEPSYSATFPVRPN